ncbi:hypothetical protein [Algoriphagus sp. CAU 1675]|uniref:hypothetical protein n=1 Tax=Algoriphagus sp. CAU 1675 TaxID=3032597 RepID=UPI0023DB5D0D|nr:hypothetical protein [Algoriphagus sp. CAU 1675]MDF2157175.1 hypothetical protein [Algoriphagus sp. CAU 1675]
MKPHPHNLPPKAVDYIRKNFQEDFLLNLSEIKMIQEEPHYFVEVAKDNYLHKLQFDKAGTLINKEATEAFPSNDHDGKTFGEIPE